MKLRRKKCSFLWGLGKKKINSVGAKVNKDAELRPETKEE